MTAAGGGDTLRSDGIPRVRVFPAGSRARDGALAMTVLVVEEGGHRRAFRVGEGRLTIGSGAGASLKLASPDVAEVHAELELREGRVLLRPRPGVVAPRMGGIPVQAEVEVPPGVPIAIGDARILVEREGAPKPAAPGGVARPGVARRGAEAAAGAAVARRTSQRPRKSSWTPILVVAVVAIAGVVLVGRLLTSQAPPVVGPSFVLEAARRDLGSGMHDQALSKLATIPRQALKDPEFRARYEALEREIEADRREARIGQENIAGTEYLQTQLKNFERNYLQGEIDRPKARVFLLRLREFQRRWPQHHELDWVRRQEERFRGVVDPDAPPSFEDVAFQFESMTWAKPRDYEGAFEILYAFAEEATGRERARALDLIAEKEREREEWFEDRQKQARQEYDQGDRGASVAVLVSVLVYAGLQEMEDWAADQLLRFDDLAPRLRSYRRQMPELYAEIVAHPAIARFVAEEMPDG